MYHVHTSTLSSSTTTTEPVSTLSPSVLFPFFQPSSASSSPRPSTTSSSSTSSSPHHNHTTTSSSSSCPCHDPKLLPLSASAPPTFISLPSANPQQSIILPLPQPSPPPASTASSAHPPSGQSADVQSAPYASASVKSPLLVFSHGSTQVDTFVPSSACLQRTLYSWSQLSDYSTKYCWCLPLTSSSSTHSTPVTGQPLGQNVSIANNNGRICQGEDVSGCPGHPWVNFSYHMQVKQWQETKDDAAAAALAAAAAAQSQQSNRAPAAAARQDLSDMGVKGLEVRVLPPSDILIEGVRRQRHQRAQQQYALADVDSDAGSMFDSADDGDEADSEEDNWNELCSSTEDDDDESELSDVDM